MGDHLHPGARADPGAAAPHVNLDTADGRSRRRCPCADITFGHEHAGPCTPFTRVRQLHPDYDGRTTTSAIVMAENRWIEA